jgi:hypothetical protein
MSVEEEPRRHRTVQALTKGLLETTVLQLEAQGWRRMGDMALARPILDSQPPYWVQSLSHPVLSPDSANPHAKMSPQGLSGPLPSPQV